MRVFAGVVITLTAVILWHILGWPFIGWLFTRIEPATPEGWTPKVHTYRDGVRVDAS